MSYKNQLLSNLLATTVLCGALGIATPALAQDNTQPPAAATTQPDEQEVTVTGSRIRQPNLTGTSPVTVVNSAEVRSTGTTRAEDLVAFAKSPILNRASLFIIHRLTL